MRERRPLLLLRVSVFSFLVSSLHFLFIPLLANDRCRVPRPRPRPPTPSPSDLLACHLKRTLDPVLTVEKEA